MTIPQTMRAAVVTEPGRLIVADVPTPKANGYASLVRVTAGATCTSTDIHIIDSTPPFTMGTPGILGHESVGEVIELGDKVKYFNIGDRVLRPLLEYTPEREGFRSYWGGFAEYALVFDWQAMRDDGVEFDKYKGYMKNRAVPPEISDAAAAMMITWRETHSFYKRLNAIGASEVLVIGSGGNGLSFAAHASSGGAFVTMTGSPSRRETAKRCGVSEYVSYRDENANEKLLSRRYDVIIDAVGASSLLNAMLPSLKRGGVFATYGIEFGGEPVATPEGTRRYGGDYLEGETHDEIIAGIKSGVYDPAPYFEGAQPYPLERINEAFAMLREKRAVKALITMR